MSCIPRLPHGSPQTRRAAPEVPQRSQKEGGFRKGGPAPPCRCQVSKGLARACELYSTPPPRIPPDPKGCTGGAPKIPERGGFRKGGPAPPCRCQVSKGLARACELYSTPPPRIPPDPKGSPRGVPKTPERGGVQEGGARPPLQVPGKQGLGPS